MRDLKHDKLDAFITNGLSPAMSFVNPPSELIPLLTYPVRRHLTWRLKQDGHQPIIRNLRLYPVIAIMQLRGVGRMALQRIAHMLVAIDQQCDDQDVWAYRDEWRAYATGLDMGKPDTTKKRRVEYAGDSYATMTGWIARLHLNHKTHMLPRVLCEQIRDELTEVIKEDDKASLERGAAVLADNPEDWTDPEKLPAKVGLLLDVHDTRNTGNLMKLAMHWSQRKAVPVQVMEEIERQLAERKEN